MHVEHKNKASRKNLFFHQNVPDDPEKVAYYEKWVPPRWDKLTEVETAACADLMEYIQNLVRDGVDLEAVRSELSFVETCFDNQGLIE